MGRLGAKSITKAAAARRYSGRLVCITAASLLAPACVTPEHKALEQVGGASCYSHALAREYLQLAYAFNSESFRRKSDNAAAGKPVNPLSPHVDRAKPDTPELSLIDGSILLSALKNWKAPNTGMTAAQKLPMELAHAQGRFDCWSTSTDWQEHGEARTCREEFKTSSCYLVSQLDPVQVDPALLRKACLNPVNPTQSTVAAGRAPHPWEC